MLNLPMQLEGHNILLCAIGGGFDIFGTLPLFYEFVIKNPNVIFSSFSLNKIGPHYKYDGSEDVGLDYFPEKLFVESTKLPINFIGKMGVSQIRSYYEGLIKDYDITHIVMVDCGVDSLMVGDEVHKGTVVEEYVNFAALQSIDIPKYHVCFGFGAEAEEKISHYRVLENISNLIQKDGYIGSCSLTKDMGAFKYYKAAYGYVNRSDHKKSHIHPRIIASIEGQFGNTKICDETIMSGDADVFLSSLMGMYWVFDGDKVIQNIPILSSLTSHRAFVQSVSEINRLPRERGNVDIPL